MKDENKHADEQFDNQVLEEVAETKLNFSLVGAINWFLAVITLLLLVTFGFRIHGLLSTRDELDTYRQEVTQREETNQRIDQQQANANQAQVKQIAPQIDEFLDLFFNYGTWNEYTENMKAIGDKFPEIANDKRIDTDAIMVGTGDSPKSTYYVNGETIGNQSETAGRLIEQSIASNDVERKVLSWYLTFSLDDDGKLKIDQINRLRVLNRYNEIKENQSPETTEELNGNPTDMAVETI